MKITIHEPDPIQGDVHSDSTGKYALVIEPFFYEGGPNVASPNVISVSNDAGDIVALYQLEVSEKGKLKLRPIGKRRQAAVDSGEISEQD